MQMLSIVDLIFYKFKYICVLALVFLLSSSALIGQDELSDDWEEELSKAKGSERVEMILSLSEDFINEDLVLTDSLVREGIILAGQMGDSLLMYRLGVTLGRVFNYRNEVDRGSEWIGRSLAYFAEDKQLNFDKAKTQLILANLCIKKRYFAKADSLISEGESYFVSTDDAFWKSEVLNKKGNLYWQQKDYIKSQNYYSEVLNIGKERGDIDQIAETLTLIGSIKARLGQFPEGLDLGLRALSLQSSSRIKAKCYSNIGSMYYWIEDFESSMKYMQISLELKKKIGLESGINSTLTNIGILHKNNGNYEEALKYLEQSLAMYTKSNLYPGSLLGTLGNIYNELGQPDKAKEYFDEYLKLAEDYNDWEGIWGIKYNKGRYLISLKQYAAALPLLLECYEIAKEKEHLQLLRLNNEALNTVYEGLENNTKATFHKEQFELYHDSIISIEKIKKIGAAEQKQLMERQKDSLDAANQGLGDNTNTLEGQSWTSSNTALAGLASGALLIGLFFFFINRKRKQETPPSESQALDQTKIEQYFEELFTRLDQNKVTTQVATNQSAEEQVAPINDMAEFLKSNLSTPNEWASFEQYFEKVHKDFFKDLKSNYPTISTNELNMCALLKLNLRNKDIAQIMGISPDSVRKAQNRLSKKMELPSNEGLRDFVLKQ